MGCWKLEVTKYILPGNPPFCRPHVFVARRLTLIANPALETANLNCRDVCIKALHLQSLAA